MTKRTCLGIILAAGEGVRMRSALPKALHKVGGLPLVAHVARALAAAGVDQIAVVIGPAHDSVANAAARAAPDAQVFVQTERLGTAHATLTARPALEAGYDDVLVVFGDTPFVTDRAIGALRTELAAGRAVVVAGMRPENPAGYGRLVMDGPRLVAIREEPDATEEERRIGLCNGGLMALDGGHAVGLLDSIGCRNAQGEFYLTDAVALANERGLAASAVEIDAAEVFGVNDRLQLAEAEARFQAVSRRRAMQAGVTLIAPETVFFSYDTQIAADVVVEPHVFFGPGVAIASGATIRAFSHLEGARVGAGATIGPHARLRPGAAIGEGARIGNFVEVKNAEVGSGAKVNHLTYIGDAAIGAHANIGAGTITCNYDGFGKYRTEIGEGAFVGSNTALVAPVTIGAGSYVASGSVITEDVPADALAFGRARQVNKPGRAAEKRRKSR